MTYTNAQINAALKESLAEKGEDYVYISDGPGCAYAHNGQPSCLVGHVLHKLDPEMFEKVVEAENNPTTGDLTFDHLAADLGLPFHPEQADALRRAQIAQDLKSPWGEAAVEYMRRLGEDEL
ncbi:hypothetical protein SEA_PAVLO_108 [Microbacterium phage Pavlo]|nr:hypothetical protein SEA_HUBBS_107 [Microbacterium phage Hubbs]UVG34164.1 hypothetical protein SEA_PAVLO_108 [Microbacterium phage Pavlo]